MSNSYVITLFKRSLCLVVRLFYYCIFSSLFWQIFFFNLFLLLVLLSASTYNIYLQTVLLFLTYYDFLLIFVLNLLSTLLSLFLLASTKKTFAIFTFIKEGSSWGWVNYNVLLYFLLLFCNYVLVLDINVCLVDNSIRNIICSNRFFVHLFLMLSITLLLTLTTLLFSIMFFCSKNTVCYNTSLRFINIDNNMCFVLIISVLQVIYLLTYFLSNIEVENTLCYTNTSLHYMSVLITSITAALFLLTILLLLIFKNTVVYKKSVVIIKTSKVQPNITVVNNYTNLIIFFSEAYVYLNYVSVPVLAVSLLYLLSPNFLIPYYLSCFISNLIFFLDGVLYKKELLGTIVQITVMFILLIIYNKSFSVFYNSRCFIKTSFFYRLRLFTLIYFKSCFFLNWFSNPRCLYLHILKINLALTAGYGAYHILYTLTLVYSNYINFFFSWVIMCLFVVYTKLVMLFYTLYDIVLLNLLSYNISNLITSNLLIIILLISVTYVIIRTNSLTTLFVLCNIHLLLNICILFILGQEPYSYFFLLIESSALFIIFISSISTRFKTWSIKNNVLFIYILVFTITSFFVQNINCYYVVNYYAGFRQSLFNDFLLPTISTILSPKLIVSVVFPIIIITLFLVQCVSIKKNPPTTNFKHSKNNLGIFVKTFLNKWSI